MELRYMTWKLWYTLEEVYHWVENMKKIALYICHARKWKHIFQSNVCSFFCHSWALCCFPLAYRAHTFYDEHVSASQKIEFKKQVDELEVPIWLHFRVKTRCPSLQIFLWSRCCPVYNFSHFSLMHSPNFHSFIFPLQCTLSCYLKTTHPINLSMICYSDKTRNCITCQIMQVAEYRA